MLNTKIDELYKNVEFTSKVGYMTKGDVIKQIDCLLENIIVEYYVIEKIETRLNKKVKKLNSKSRSYEELCKIRKVLEDEFIDQLPDEYNLPEVEEEEETTEVEEEEETTEVEEEEETTEVEEKEETTEVKTNINNINSIDYKKIKNVLLEKKGIKIIKERRQLNRFKYVNWKNEYHYLNLEELILLYLNTIGLDNGKYEEYKKAKKQKLKNKYEKLKEKRLNFKKEVAAFYNS